MEQANGMRRRALYIGIAGLLLLAGCDNNQPPPPPPKPSVIVVEASVESITPNSEFVLAVPKPMKTPPSMPACLVCC